MPMVSTCAPDSETGRNGDGRPVRVIVPTVGVPLSVLTPKSRLHVTPLVNSNVAVNCEYALSSRKERQN